jgi:hypothetical protein
MSIGVAPVRGRASPYPGARGANQGPDERPSGEVAFVQDRARPRA